MVRGLAAESESSYDESARLGDGAPELESAYLQNKIERLKEDIKDLQQDRDQRKTFSYMIFVFMCVYVVAVFVILFLCGFGKMTLSDSVLITLLTTALANVIGVFTFVAKYLFHNK